MYKTILLKLSGEALGNKSGPYDFKYINILGLSIIEAYENKLINEEDYINYKSIFIMGMNKFKHNKKYPKNKRKSRGGYGNNTRNNFQ